MAQPIRPWTALSPHSVFSIQYSVFITAEWQTRTPGDTEGPDREVWDAQTHKAREGGTPASSGAAGQADGSPVP